MSFIIASGLESNTVHPYPSKLITQGYGSNPSTTATGTFSGITPGVGYETVRIEYQKSKLEKPLMMATEILLLQNRRLKRKLRAST